MQTEQTYSTKIGKIVATKLGSPNLPVVLFLPGLRHPATMWMPFAEALKDRYHCVLLDWPGQGKAKEPATADTTIEAMAAALLAVVEQSGWTRLHVVGFSMGGMAAIPFANVLCSQGECSTLTLIGTSASEEPWLNRNVRFRFMLACVRWIGWHALVGTAAKLFYSANYLQSDEGRTYERIKRMLIECGPLKDATLAHAVVYRRTQPDEVLRGIICPTLIMRGQCDIVRSLEETKRMCDLIPNANKTPLQAEKSGHGVCSETPEFVLKNLSTHLDSHSR